MPPNLKLGGGGGDSPPLPPPPPPASYAYAMIIEGQLPKTELQIEEGWSFLSSKYDRYTTVQSLKLRCNNGSCLKIHYNG